MPPLFLGAVGTGFMLRASVLGVSALRQIDQRLVNSRRHGRVSHTEIQTEEQKEEKNWMG